MKKLLTIVSITLLLVISESQASSLFLEGGLHGGGDKIASATFSGGGSDSIDAGGLFGFSAGLVTDINENTEIRTSAGIKFDIITAENGDLDFIRFPINIMIFSKGENFSFGIGATYHLDPTFETSGFPGNNTINFDDALGFMAEIDYMLGEKAYLGLQATAIDYEVSNASGSAEIDGNSFGIVIGIRF